MGALAWRTSIEIAHVDAELQGGCANDAGVRAAVKALFGSLALLQGNRAMMHEYVRRLGILGGALDRAMVGQSKLCRSGAIPKRPKGAELQHRYAVRRILAISESLTTRGETRPLFLVF